ncbi:hypothetical protein PRIPAC_88922, partial [Pristionchus pacificus]|uniref:Uncharacterized protein n=1 Tax=Pristionchus pacificus TaxID=54126 RepID=A0A2A6CVH2_PRIPA
MHERCCCGCFPITVGAQILAVLQVVGTTQALFYFFNPEDEFFTLNRAAVLVAYSFQFISNVLVILADILLIITYILTIVGLFYLSSLPDEIREQFPGSSIYIVFVLINLGFGLSMLFAHWLLEVFKSCYEHIKVEE